MSDRLQRADLNVASEIVNFVENEALGDAGISADTFWAGVSDIIADLTPTNRALLAARDERQARLDEFHRQTPGQPDPETYRAFLTEIGYLLPEPEAFTITTSNVDAEIATMAGPQLVVPLLNARFAVNAANARWGSLYDALYGTDAISQEGDLVAGADYNPLRGNVAIARGRALLDEAAPLGAGSHTDAVAYRVEGGTLRVELADGSTVTLADPAVFIGYTGDAETPATILLRHNGLHIEIVIDRTGTIGSTDRAGVQDLVLESAVTTIMDLEDSVAAVDAEDKALGYHNWRELMMGTLSETVTKGDRTFVRTMNPDRVYTGPDGAEVVVPGRSMLLVRNVGHLMQNDAVIDRDGNDVYEGILDAIMTTLGALPNLNGTSTLGNSRSGSLYIVKPKMHGPDEVAFAVELFSRVEKLLGLPANSLKIGIMDEERRTTVNLRACINEASERVVFINTGFLDRTGDEIHTSLLAGPMVFKADMRAQGWLPAYEKANVDAGLRTGFPGHAQIGKGMWAMPDLMHDMLEQKIAHPRAGANTAWVPSPTAATLHSLHYHEVNPFDVQRELAAGPRQPIEPILVLPLATSTPTAEAISEELDNNSQSILGYVVRWVDQGVGCSKVPDIHGVGLMEDRATLRISSQLMANWLAHGLITEAQVDESLRRMAPIVDGQNAGDASYEALIGADGPGLAWNAARSLIIEGAKQPNGYTEPILHQVRRAKKAQQAAS